MCTFVKIFLPKYLYKNKNKITSNLYGRAIATDTKSFKFFVLETDTKFCKYLDLVGIVDDDEFNGHVEHKTNYPGNHISFTYNENSNLLLKGVRINGNELNNDQLKIQLILYDRRGFDFLSNNSNDFIDITSETDEFTVLRTLIKEKNEYFNNGISVLDIFLKLLLMFCEPLSKIIGFFAKEFEVYSHFDNWIKFLKDGKFDRRKFITIVFDVLAGVLVLYLIWFYVNPADYLMKCTLNIVNYLRILLDGLKGNPAGLKLNSQLNQFLREGFKYHIDLWAAFLQIVSPAISYLFIPLGILGIFGLSFQLAMLSDLLVLITLHAHCFYIYAALLYRLEVIGLKALWRVMFGRRFNVLKKRVESYDYENSQLYLATMFFAGLLFLLPTIVVYYTVFSALRFFIYCVTYTLMKLRRKILTIPIYSYIQWMMKRYVTHEAIELKVMNIEKVAVNFFRGSILVIAVRPKSALPESIVWGFLNNEDRNKQLLPVSDFLISLIKGEMMGFVTPKIKNLKVC